MIDALAPYLVPAFYVGGPLLALAALAWIGDRLTDRHVATAPRLPRTPSQVTPGTDDWRDLTPAFIGGRHATRTAVALARTSSTPQNNEGRTASTAGPLTIQGVSHGQQYP